MNDLSANDLKQFFDHLDAFEKELQLKRKQDEFLDAYNTWLQNKTDDVKERINSLAKELTELDPTFKFSPLE